MREINIGINDDNQRVDRFLKKYLENAPLSFIYKHLRKKNIKVNDKKADPETILSKGDIITLYFSDETIDKYVAKPVDFKGKEFPKILYEDDNIILINKPLGILSHSAQGEYEKNIVDQMINYLIKSKAYVPRVEKSFVPAICNRLDRNTSGILIGAKNAAALREINAAIRNKDIEKYYLAIVAGEFKGKFKKKSFLSKREDKNMVNISGYEEEGSKEIETVFYSLKHSKEYSLLEVNLITGRTHQIRVQLQDLGYPIVGDRKYGRRRINELFEKKYRLQNQLLHNYKIVFNGLKGNLDYLNGREFILAPSEKFKEIESDLWRKL